MSNKIIYYNPKLNKNSFTAKYNVDGLVYYETFTDICAVIEREKELKKWRRQWKINLSRKR